MRKKAINYLLGFVFAAALVNILVSQIILGFAKESWQITEWLISYRGGFVRRGLAGEVVWQAHRILGFDPYLLIVTLCFVFFAILVTFFVLNFIKKGFPLILLGGVFLLGGPILNNYWVRKDVLSILFFSVVIYLISHKQRLNLVFANLFLVIMLFIHESIGFYGLPIIILILMRSGSAVGHKYFSVRSLVLACLKFTPAIIVFILCLVAKGNLATSISIWNSWKNISFPNQIPGANPEIPSAIAGIYWTLPQGLDLFRQTLKNFSDGFYAPIMWMFIGSSAFYIVANLEKLGVKDFVKKNAINVLFWQGICVVPLAILGWDYGRWLFIWIASSFVLLLIVPQRVLKDVFPRIFSRVSMRVGAFLDSIYDESGSNVRILFLFLGAPQYGWRLPDYLMTTPFFVTINYVSDIIKSNFF